MHYRTIANLNEDVIEWSRRLPQDLDLVVGVPRSGLLVANLLALHLNVPFTDVDGLIAGRLLSTGKRINDCAASLLQSERKLRVLVVDDSVWSGGQMSRTRAKIEGAVLPHSIIYGAVYVVHESDELIDTYHSKVPVPRAFEWNILHHPALEESCVALEGILLPRLAGAEALTRESLQHVRPIFKPTMKIGCLVAIQPEEARPVLTEWLAERGIAYDVLALISPENRDDDDILRDKAALYRRSRAWVYMESAADDAERLAQAARRPVYCSATRQMLYPGSSTASAQQPAGSVWAAMRLRDLCDAAYSKVFGREVLGKGHR